MRSVAGRVRLPTSRLLARCLEIARLITRCQALGFVEALLVGSGGGRLWLFLVVGVGGPGGVDALPGALLIEAGTVADEFGLVQRVEGPDQSKAEKSRKESSSTRRMRPPRTGPGSARSG